MKLSNEVLLEIVSIFQDGLLGKRDASQALRELDMVASGDEIVTLVFTRDYLAAHPRAQLKDEKEWSGEAKKEE